MKIKSLLKSVVNCFVYPWNIIKKYKHEINAIAVIVLVILTLFLIITTNKLD